MANFPAGGEEANPILSGGLRFSMTSARHLEIPAQKRIVILEASIVCLQIWLSQPGN